MFSPVLFNSKWLALVKREDPPRPSGMCQLMLGGSWHLLSQLYDRAVPIYSRQGPPTLKSCSKNGPTTHKHNFSLFPPHWCGFRGSADLQCRGIYHIIAISGDTVGLPGGKHNSKNGVKGTLQCIQGDFILPSFKIWGNFRSGKKKF